MRYRELLEFTGNQESNDQSDQSVKKPDVIRPEQNNKPSIQMTPQLQAAIQASVPKQSDPRREVQLFNLILSQITDVNKFLSTNHSDIRHYLAARLSDHTVKVDDDEVEDAIKNATFGNKSRERSRESDNNYIRQVGKLLIDDIYRVTMTYQNELGVSSIDQRKLDAVSRNEGKQYSAKKFDQTIRTMYNTDTYIVVLIENLDEASTYLIILCDLATGKIYCGRKYSRLILVTSESGQLSTKRIRSKIIYNENSPAQRELFRIVVPQIQSYDSYMKNKDIEGLFIGLDVPYDRERPVKQRNK